MKLLRQAADARDSGILSPESIRSIMNVADRPISNTLFGEYFNLSIKNSRVYTLLSAAHIVLYIGLRAVLPNTALAHLLIQRLQFALLSQESHDRLAVFPADEDFVLLWEAFVGLAACGSSHIFDGSRNFYLLLIEKQVEKTKVERTLLSIEDLQHHLESSLWIDTFCRPAFQGLRKMLRSLLPEGDLTPTPSSSQ